MTDIIAMLVLSFALLSSALIWQWYLERKTTFSPIIRTSVLTRSKGKLALVCFVVVSPCYNDTDGDGSTSMLIPDVGFTGLFYGML